MDTNMIKRIETMELYFDTVTSALSRNPKLIDDICIAKMLRRLKEYYSSGQWLCDYEADERGEIPHRIKRGVLSQDGLYNLFDEISEVMEENLPSVILYDRYIEMEKLSLSANREGVKNITMKVGSAIMNMDAVKRCSLSSVIADIEKTCGDKMADLRIEKAENSPWDGLDWSGALYMIVRQLKSKGRLASFSIFTDKSDDAIYNVNEARFNLENDRNMYFWLARNAAYLGKIKP